MTRAEHIQRFSEELRQLICRYDSEYDLNISEIIGVIEIVKHEALSFAMDTGGDDEGQPEPKDEEA